VVSNIVALIYQASGQIWCGVHFRTDKKKSGMEIPFREFSQDPFRHARGWAIVKSESQTITESGTAIDKVWIDLKFALDSGSAGLRSGWGDPTDPCHG
jgi:hypothetical protein